LLKWIDPETGQRRFKSAKTKKRSEANQQAGLLAKELTEGKYASAHDLRRSFGSRWADRVDTFKLQELMRHSNIETTRRYYVGRNAQNTAAALWSARDRATGNAPEMPAGRNTLDNNRPDERTEPAQETTQALA
jgi:integrase